MPEIAQPVETRAEFFSHGTLVSKTLVLIPDLKIRQCRRKDLSVELGISP